MPAKHKVKKYVPGGIYYIYSRAEEDRNVFEDEVDYWEWQKLMARYTGGVTESSDRRFKPDRPYRVKHKKEMALVGQVQILAYCQLQRSVHLLVRQKEPDGITKLMRRMVTGYTMYLNRRHGKQGKVFAGVYKGVLVDGGSKVVWLSRWIHRLPGGRKIRRFGLVASESVFRPEEYLYSSYGNFIKNEKNQWFDPGVVLAEFEKLAFGKWKSYRELVEDEGIRDEEWLGEMVDG